MSSLDRLAFCYVLSAAHRIFTVSRKLRRPGTLKSISSPELFRLKYLASNGHRGFYKAWWKLCINLIWLRLDNIFWGVWIYYWRKTSFHIQLFLINIFVATEQLKFNKSRSSHLIYVTVLFYWLSLNVFAFYHEAFVSEPLQCLAGYYHISCGHIVYTR